MTAELLRSHVTDSSARLAAIEALPQRDFLQTILQRGNHFLKRFRQRLAQSISTETTERSSHEIKPTEQRKSTRISASSPRDNPCLERDSTIAALEAIADGGISYLLPYAQFLYAEKISNPALEKEPDAPPEKMLIHFACADVVVLGSGLKRLEQEIQKYELKFVKSADRRFAATLKTHIAAVTVTLTKENI